MSTSVLRYAPPVLPDVLSRYPTLLPPLSKSSAWTAPGSVHALPPNALAVPEPDEVEEDEEEPLLSKLRYERFPTNPYEPFESNRTRISWTPASRDTVVPRSR